MATIRAHGTNTELWYDTFGDPAHPPLLLIMGLGMQGIGWDPVLCERLATGGRHVIRFDNRDVGLSEKFPGRPYALDDLARDTIGLLDGLGHRRAHVVGASMGGMVAQLVALAAPQRVASLTSIMSTTGEQNLEQPDPAAIVALMRPRGTGRAQWIEDGVAVMRTLAGTAMAFDEEWMRRRITEAIDRQYYPDGFLRQFQAIMAATPRADRLRALRDVPTLVLHGTADPLVPVSHGRRTAELIPGARFVPLEGMGHGLPPALWPRVAAEILTHTA